MVIDFDTPTQEFEMLTQPRHAWKWVVGVLVGLVVLLVGGMSAYAFAFANKALPGTSLAGTSLMGMTRNEVSALVSERAESTEVTFTVDGTDYTAPLEELGVSIDVEATVAEVFSYNNSFFRRIAGLFAGHDKTAVYELDEGTLADYLDEVASAEEMTASDAKVELNSDGTAFVVVEAVEGMRLDSAQVEALVTQAAKNLTSAAGRVEAVEAAPVVSTADAEAVAAAANAIVALEVGITDQNDEEIEAEAADKAAWVSIETNEDGTLADPTINEEALQKWVEETAQSTNVEAKNGVRNVNSAGKVLSTPTKGSAGYQVNNADSVAQELVEALEAGEPYSGSFEYDVTEPTYEQRLIADGAENLAYPAAPGEKWIDINLTKSTVTAYEGATVVYGPVSVVIGASGTETVTGQYKVYLKYETQTMRGTNLDGTPYVSENVPWISYFYLGYALHGAPSRSTFGWEGYNTAGGSHGCVNMPVSAAKWIYDWDEIGTVVVSHY